MLAHPRVVGRRLDGDVHRQLHALRLRRLAEARQCVQSTQLWRHRVVATVGRADGVWTAGVAGFAFSVLLAPLRFVRPMGWIGGMYTTSKPSLAISGRRQVASSKVVGCGLAGSRPCERGKSSYQAPKRARSRSTISGSSAERVAAARSG